MTHRNEVITGIFVLVGIAVIAGGSLWLSGDRWRGTQRSLVAHFATVGQLREGNPVSVQGVRVGRVQAIQLAEDGRVQVEMRVEAETPLPTNAVVVLQPASLFGDWEAAIVPASSRPELQVDTLALPADEIPGVTASDFAVLADHTSDIAANLRGITDRLQLAFNEETARNLSRAIGNFERASQELVDLLGRQREGFGQFADDLEEASATVRDAADALDETLSRLARATEEGELEEIFDRARSASVSLDTLSREWVNATREVRGAMSRISQAADTAQILLSRINRGEGSLGRLTADTALYENTAAAVGELRALLDDLRRNPRKYFSFSVF